MNNESILRKFISRVWNEQDMEAVDEFLADAYTIHLDNGDPWEGKTLSREEFKERLMYSFNSFPDIHFDIRLAIADGNNVAITWILTGSNLGKIESQPATGKKIEAPGMTIYHFRNGKICGHSQVLDRNLVAKQLGFI